MRASVRQAGMSETPSVIEYSINDGATWHHGRTVEAWVTADPAVLGDQRAVVRGLARGWHGNVEHVVTRVLADDDPRGMLNQPVAAYEGKHRGGEAGPWMAYEPKHRAPGGEMDAVGYVLVPLEDSE